jgi:diguanylate cyclase (GGDEF)-like protein
MNENISFYRFMHKQILVVIALFMGTGPGYIMMGALYGSVLVESAWFIFIIIVSLYGYKLYRDFSLFMTIEQKDFWLDRVRFFMFAYFSLWSIIFLVYVLKDNHNLHYIAIATQLGSAVVASTILASQKNLVIVTVITLILPITIYLLAVGEVYSYLIAFFTVVLSGVLLYAAKNTHDYLIKSRYQSYHDHLTGLGNRRYFLEILESSVKQNCNKYSYLLLIDLDYFKTINDTLGHDIGDELLIEVSKRMTKLAHENNNTAARLGGDEFCILSTSFETKDECLKAADSFSKELLRRIKANYIIDDHHLYISASIGISIMNKPILQAGTFLKEADMAMYEVKHSGRDGVILFSEELCEIVEKKLDIERMLHFAIERDEITLKYQPQVDKNKKVLGCEILVRWNNKELGNIGPATFIPIAENTGYIIELGAYILEESLKTIQEWSKKSMSLQQVSINISMRQLLHQNFIQIVTKLLEKYIDDECKIGIVFEITETSTADNLTSLIDVINTLKKYNITFSMDDFGTGYSSLSYLREIPIRELKVDQSFVAKLSGAKEASLVKTIVDISKNFSLITVAEGVEEEYQREYLMELGCDLYQGYLFSKPLTKEGFEDFFRFNMQ